MSAHPAGPRALLVEIKLFRCSQCGTLATPPDGVQNGACGLRRGLGVPPARVCHGTMEYIGTVAIMPPHESHGGEP